MLWKFDIIMKYPSCVFFIYSFWQATPSLIGSFGAALMNSTILSRDSSLRILSFGGEPCPSGSTLKRWKEKGNTTRIINLYGITEVSSWATYYELTDQDIELSRI